MDVSGNNGGPVRRSCARLLITAAFLLAACTHSTGDTTAPASLSDPPESTATTQTTSPPTTSTPAAPTPTTAATGTGLRRVRVAVPSTSPLVIEDGNPVSLALATSRAMFESSPAVVVAAGSERRTIREGATTAEAVGVPLLLAGPHQMRAVAREIRRLGSRWVIVVGAPRGELRAMLPAGVAVVKDPLRVPAVGRAPRAERMAVLADRDDPAVVGPVATARAARIPVVPVVQGDPRATIESRKMLRRIAPRQVIAIGSPGTFPSARVLHGLVGTAQRGPDLPGGGQVLFPGRRLVALYGHPRDANLGVLGEQSPGDAVRRARRLARRYEERGAPAIPTFDIITTLASSEAGSDGDYSIESTLDQVLPWVEAAEAAGVYVVLELQPGHTDFLSQARRYERLLIKPHVGLALDPEWRLTPGQKHVRDVGQVTAREVNGVAAWLAALTRRHALPQKLLLIQQFRRDMVLRRDAIANHPELALVVQMDGLGRQHTKLDTWGAITRGRPPGIRFGWKHFYDEDRPVRSPADTIALRPSPVYVSYQ